MMQRDYRGGKQDMFSKLPIEITMEILSRLPINRASMRCKVVCKAWLDLLESEEFCNSHLRRAAEAEPNHVAVFLGGDAVDSSNPYQIIELPDDDGVGVGDAVVKFGLGFPKKEKIKVIEIRSSVNGLLLLCNRKFRETGDINFLIYNPMTREMMRVPNPPTFSRDRPRLNIGFGVSRKGGQYKIVRTTLRRACRGRGGGLPPPPVCQIYTLGTKGSWRSFWPVEAEAVPFTDSVAAFANGNLHWLDYGPDSRLRICCLDLETEEFSCIPPPPRQYGRGIRNLAAWRDRLCLCDNVNPDELHIWSLMKEELDGGGWRWTKEFSIVTKSHHLQYKYLFPIKTFLDGIVLLGNGSEALVYYYSDEAKAVVKDAWLSRTSAFVYTPSFLPLKTQTRLIPMEEEFLTSF